MKDSISMADVFRICLKRRFLIITITIICSVVAYLYSEYIVTPMYKSEGQLNITNRNEAAETTNEVTSGGIQAGTKLAPIFIEILKTDTFLSQVKNTGNFDLSEADIRGMMILEQPEETTIIKVRVNSKDAKEAHMVADQIVYLAPRYLEEKVRGSSVEVIQDAKLEIEPYSPNVVNNVVFGFLIGLVIGIVTALCLELFSKKISGSETLEETYGYPVLGEIPNLRGGRGSGVY